MTFVLGDTHNAHIVILWGGVGFTYHCHVGLITVHDVTDCGHIAISGNHDVGICRIATVIHINDGHIGLTIAVSIITDSQMTIDFRSANNAHVAFLL